MTIDLFTKTGDGGRLFGSITNKEVAEALKEKYNIEVERRKIEIKDPIKALGTYTLQAKLHPEVIAEFKINVKAQ